jgi:hypothetical protein
LSDRSWRGADGLYEGGKRGRSALGVMVGKEREGKGRKGRGVSPGSDRILLYQLVKIAARLACPAFDRGCGSGRARLGAYARALESSV